MQIDRILSLMILRSLRNRDTELGQATLQIFLAFDARARRRKNRVNISHRPVMLHHAIGDHCPFFYLIRLIDSRCILPISILLTKLCFQPSWKRASLTEDNWIWSSSALRSEHFHSGNTYLQNAGFRASSSPHTAAYGCTG